MRTLKINGFLIFLFFAWARAEKARINDVDAHIEFVVSMFGEVVGTVRGKTRI